MFTLSKSIETVAVNQTHLLVTCQRQQSKSFKGARTRYIINPLFPIKLCYQRSTGEKFDTLFKSNKYSLSNGK